MSWTEWEWFKQASMRPRDPARERRETDKRRVSNHEPGHCERLVVMPGVLRAKRAKHSPHQLVALLSSRVSNVYQTIHIVLGEDGC